MSKKSNNATKQNNEAHDLRTTFEKLGESFEPGDVPSIDTYRMSLLIAEALLGTNVELQYLVAESDETRVGLLHADVGEFDVTIKPYTTSC